MSHDLQGYLRTRAHVGETPFGTGLMLSVCVHLAVLTFFLLPRPKAAEPEPVKVTWVSLPAARSQSGGAEAREEGKTGERLRQVEEVAPKAPDAMQHATQAQPDPFGLKGKDKAKGTNPDQTSTGKAAVASKGAKASPNAAPGAAGVGGAGGVGAGSSIPGLNPTNGVEGGVGLIGGVDGDFPFTWYLQQVQGRIVGNWQRLGGQGRVQIYFRIKRDGSIEGARVESPSGNDAMDQSALLAVRRAAPLPPLPGIYGADYLGVRFWFSYVGN
ncbi:MAG TPA: TonB family protein [Holophagaceae bacterium]|nr:TonB family protein [Holophagaceae bacterium]